MFINGKTIDIYKADRENAPLVILNEYMRSGGEIYQKCRDTGCPDFTLAEITGLNWENEMSPWKMKPLGKNDPPFGGMADEYLLLLLNSIIPAIKTELKTEPAAILLAGYSLAGLFALYAAGKCSAFQAIASCSGSLWFPGITDYIKEQPIEKLPDIIYFSLGDREARTRHEILRTVEDNTRDISDYLARHGINTILEMNKGNHFQQPALRTAKGIKWILEMTE